MLMHYRTSDGIIKANICTTIPSEANPSTRDCLPGCPLRNLEIAWHVSQKNELWVVIRANSCHLSGYKKNVYIENSWTFVVGDS